MKKTLPLLSILILLSSLVPLVYSPSPFADTVVRLDPSTVEFGPEYCVGETFTLSAKIEDVEELAGFALQITWNTTYFEYVDHTITMPVEDYPNGILHEYVFVSIDDVNEIHGTYDICAQNYGGTTFYGNGTTFEITLRVKHQPIQNETDITTIIRFTYDVLHTFVQIIPHTLQNCNVIIHAYNDTTLKVLPETIELGPLDVVDQIITVAVVIEDVTDLQGLDIEFAWNTTFLDYDSHVITMPVDVFPSPQPPSPYAGILNGPTIPIIDLWDPPNGTCEVAVAASGPPFTGSGTVFVISFEVIDQPQMGEEDVILEWGVLSTELANSQGNPISHQVQGGIVIIHVCFWNLADINQDLKVDIFDVVLGINAYGSTPLDPNWDPRCDLVEPFDEIHIFDVVMICINYGEEYTP